ncbi:MAG TPA: S8 family serine peptidase [Pyrinomonadaceae bacterium]|jgi:subtilisin family serine protease
MYSFRYGGKRGERCSLKESNDLIVVRTCNRNPLMVERSFATAPVSDASLKVLDSFELVTRFRQAGVEVLRAKSERAPKRLCDEARAALKKEPEIEFAGRVLVDPRSSVPVIYTENFFVKFDDDLSQTMCRKILKGFGLKVKRAIEYSRNAYFVQAPENTGLEVFDIAEKLLREPGVALCHPELVREVRSRGAFPQQWHLKRATVGGNLVDAHASVESAWSLAQGEGVTIAVIDTGIEFDHEEFASSGKVVAPANVSVPEDDPKRNDPRPVFGEEENHGTACAGVACADGRKGASGVAPKARLMPIRLMSGLGSQAEADAFFHAAANGADVISCSWGPRDGKWWDPSDPVHNNVALLPDSTREAIDWAVRNGRNGKGCVIIWAAGNGNESVDNDGYAKYEKVTAVAACNDRGVRSAYSDFGGAVWCAFPSSQGEKSLTPGIWTTDRSGARGYNRGLTEQGDAGGNYTNSFGGTSSAAPGAAGAAALILSRNPVLRWDEVKDIIKRSADRIDGAGGNYDANGHSTLYGFGRVNARRAVELALPPQPNQLTTASVKKDVPIKDLQKSRLSVEVADAAALKDLKVSVDIEHTYIGDLVVTLIPPSKLGAASVMLHNRAGGGQDNLKETYDTVKAPGLVALVGKSPKGTWTLEVADKAKEDVGKIRGFSLELHF